MKLLTIKSIKGYKSFQNFSWNDFLKTEKFHGGMNILFGENGTGKSAVCKILKSVFGNEVFPVEPDETSHYPDEVRLEFDDREHKYSGRSWDSQKKQEGLLFFDREFITQNVHLGQERGREKEKQEQKSGNLIIQCDQKALELKDEREKAREQKEKKDKEIKAFEAAHHSILFFPLSGEEKRFYDNHKDKSVMEIVQRKEALESKKQEINSGTQECQNRLPRLSEIKNINALAIPSGQSASFSDFGGYQSVFNFDLKEQTKIAADKALIEKIRENKNFFERGFKIRETHKNKCPFCQSENQEAEIQEIINLHRQIYDKTYDEQLLLFGNEKQKLIGEISRIMNGLSETGKVLDNAFAELRKMSAKHNMQNVYFAEQEEKFQKPTAEKIKHLQEKLSNLEKPDRADISGIYRNAEAEYKEIIKFSEKVTALIAEKNLIIARFKADNTDDNLRAKIEKNAELVGEIDKELEFINQQKTTKQKEKESKEQKLKSLKEDLARLKNLERDALKVHKNYCESAAFKNILLKMKGYFHNFNLNLKLELATERAGIKTNFPFSFKVLDLQGKPRSFEDGLSEGEMQVLSLSFFFAFLDIQEDKEGKILLFDDPITSMDNGNISRLVEEIFNKQEDFSQTFVFTHHKTLREFLSKRFGKFSKNGGKNYNEYNILRNSKVNGGSFISPFKPKEFIKKLRKIETLHVEDVEYTTIKYGQYLRYAVERFIKSDLLHWNKNDMPSIISGIKSNQNVAAADLDKIIEIYSFCNWTTSHVNVGDSHSFEQLKRKISDFIKIVNKTTDKNLHAEKRAWATLRSPTTMDDVMPASKDGTPETMGENLTQISPKNSEKVV